MSLHDQLRERLKKAPQYQNACCNDVHNLRYAVSENTRMDRIALRCKHCGAIHYRAMMSPVDARLRAGRM